MGTWGTNLFEDDVAFDLRALFEDAIAEGKTVPEATNVTTAQMRDEFHDPDDGSVLILALAELLIEKGELPQTIRSFAINIIDSGLGSVRWEKDADQKIKKQRIKVLKTLRQRLVHAPIAAWEPEPFLDFSDDAARESHPVDPRREVRFALLGTIVFGLPVGAATFVAMLPFAQDWSQTVGLSVMALGFIAGCGLFYALYAKLYTREERLLRWQSAWQPLRFNIPNFFHGGKREDVGPPAHGSLAHEIDRTRLYPELFRPIETEFGQRGPAVHLILSDFPAGGPMCLQTFGTATDDFRTYATDSLCAYPELQIGDDGPYELMVTCNNESWAMNRLADVARLGFETPLGHGHTVDLGQMVDPTDPIQAVALEEFAHLSIEGKPYRLLRCHGILRAELEFAQAQSVDKLFDALKKAKLYPRTDTQRFTSVV